MLIINSVQDQLSTFFGAPQIAIADIGLVEKSAPNLIVYALPAVLAITVLEFVLSYFLERKNYEGKEVLGSIFVGAGNLMINLVMKTVMLYAVVWLYNLIPYRMPLNWWTLIPCFLIYDFCTYCTHYVSHFCRFFWASHVVHHSADHYNLTVNFRQSWFQYTKIIFFIPLMLTGVHPVIFFVANQLSILYQFWVHTEAIGKLHPFIEKHFGTPSNHRVHHGSQEKYLDKNFSAVFMVWDHLLGTFQYEEEPPVYGITSPLKSKINPLYLNLHEFQDIIKDVKQADTLKRKLYYVFASPDNIAKSKLTVKENTIKTLTIE
ncbi:sterol desaturase/sphingolipid hydroxylase (fatty acid hydroxylase superfamily) [Pedobacter cryoconitis]|uniref:Sterol desaturase/sphingolipid hydroxylase (Fatty acid hydroxylase superfamily) n=1 Tax=Pedobacter cryoconitis TaxID=188932 RepID=A0A7W8ZM64_9SPHI|nr:sterol desaturase family protein [Pedobacter cryoconitis]MBB5636405.1 sterol desaturase/sphingolipid hydroxylase (fatty acid hydroxylase superfamily) [Pedobacter cryoconitis]